MLAGLLRIIGVHMGDEIKPDKHEDRELFRKSPKEMGEIIWRRNTKHEVWGWKDPWIGRTIGQVHKLLINPVFFMTNRDPEGAIQSDLRRNPNARRPYVEKRNKGLANQISAFLAEWDYPRWEVKYRMLCLDPIAQMLGMKALLHMIGNVDMGSPGVTEAELQRCREFIQPGGYRSL